MSTSGPSVTDKIKSMFGLPSQAAPRPVNIKVPGDQQRPIQRQDSWPEICSTPSEVGILEVAHNKSLLGPDGKFSWRKFFEAPNRSSSNMNGGSGGAATAGAASGSAASSGQ